MIFIEKERNLRQLLLSRATAFPFFLEPTFIFFISLLSLKINQKIIFQTLFPLRSSIYSIICFEGKRLIISEFTSFSLAARLSNAVFNVSFTLPFHYTVLACNVFIKIEVFTLYLSESPMSMCVLVVDKGKLIYLVKNVNANY